MAAANDNKKVLMVVTNYAGLLHGKATGWYLPEVAHPLHVFHAGGWKVDFVSPLGGKAPMDVGSGEAFAGDEICANMLKDQAVMDRLNATMKPSDLSEDDVKSYSIVFYAGGHGPMFDLPSCEEIAKFASTVYENGGVVGAVCHGPVGLVPVKLSNGDALVKDKSVTCFTNEEEEAVKLTGDMPFLLETRLGELGGNFKGGDMWGNHVESDQRVVTGQNPASATSTAEACIAAVQQ